MKHPIHQHMEWDGKTWSCGEYRIMRVGCCSWHLVNGGDHHGRFADFSKAAEAASLLMAKDRAEQAEQDEQVLAPPDDAPVFEEDIH